jgi:hypothetical protein
MNKPNIAIASIILNDPAAPGANYTHAVEVAGGRPFFVGNIANEEEAQYILEHFDGLLLTGGCDLRAEIINQPLHEKTEEVPLERAARKAMMAADRELREFDDDDDDDGEDAPRRRKRNERDEDDVVLEESYNVLMDLIRLIDGREMPRPRGWW